VGVVAGQAVRAEVAQEEAAAQAAAVVLSTGM
jgi:hypothetical protein